MRNSNINRDSNSSSPRKNRRRRELLKIVVLGDSGVGKTSILNRYHTGVYSGHYKATIGADFYSKELNLSKDNNSNNKNNDNNDDAIYKNEPADNEDDDKVTLQIWDTAGQERFQSLGNAFYRGADAAILVYDVSSPTSLQHVAHWQRQFMNHTSCSSTTTPPPSEVPMIVFGNKSDLMMTSPEEVMIPSPSSAKYEGTLPHYNVSAKSNLNITEGFEFVVRQALVRYRTMQQSKLSEFGSMNTPMIQLDSNFNNVGNDRSQTSFNDECC